MDFDDLLFNTNILFRDHPDVMLKYQQRFQYILVDENRTPTWPQYNIVRTMAARHENLTVVGDDSQSIYAFRGASIQNILNFRNDYPDHAPSSWSRTTAARRPRRGRGQQPHRLKNRDRDQEDHLDAEPGGRRHPRGGA